MKHNIENVRLIYSKRLKNILKRQQEEYNELRKLLMDEWSLQGLPFVLSRLHIPLQTPAVVSQIINIPSALIAFLHIIDIFVKVLTLFFTEVSTILWKILQMRPEKMHFH